MIKDIAFLLDLDQIPSREGNSSILLLGEATLQDYLEEYSVEVVDSLDEAENYFYDLIVAVVFDQHPSLIIDTLEEEYEFNSVRLAFSSEYRDDVIDLLKEHRALYKISSKYLPDEGTTIYAIDYSYL